MENILVLREARNPRNGHQGIRCVGCVARAMNWMAENKLLTDDADVTNEGTRGNDRTYFAAVGTYYTKGQPLDSGLCCKERVVGVPRKGRGRKRSSGGQSGVIIQTKTMIFKCVE